jgi:hypothetical protein
MTTYERVPSPIEHLYYLTLRHKGELSSAYSMGTSIASAFEHYLDRLNKRHENDAAHELVDGDLADPRTHVRR